MYYFIVNTYARTGNASEIWSTVQMLLKQKGIAYRAYETASKGHAVEIVRELTEHAAEKLDIVILGGDGTINEVVNGISDFDKARIGIIPTGTGNDFARNHGIKGTPEEVLDDILQGGQGTKLDVGVVRWGDSQERRMFNISSGIGLDALVCKKNAVSKIKRICNSLHLGKLSYLIITVQSLFSMKTYDAVVNAGGDKVYSYRKAIFSAAMNLHAEGGGVPMAPSANAYDGCIPLCIAADIPGIVLPFYLILLVLGRHERMSCFHIHQSDTYHVHTDMPVVLHADGEYLADVTDVWYECLPHMLELLNSVKKH